MLFLTINYNSKLINAAALIIINNSSFVVIENILHQSLITPNSTRIILRSRDYGVSLIVEGAREDFIFVSVEHLNFLACISVPNTASLIAGCSDDLIALGVELNL